MCCWTIGRLTEDSYPGEFIGSHPPCENANGNYYEEVCAEGDKLCEP